MSTHCSTVNYVKYVNYVAADSKPVLSIPSLLQQQHMHTVLVVLTLMTHPK